MQRTALVVVEGHVRNEVQYVAPSCRLPPRFWRWWWGGGRAASAAAQQCPPPERPRGVRSTATSASAAGWTPCVARAQRWAPPAPARWCGRSRRSTPGRRCWSPARASRWPTSRCSDRSRRPARRRAMTAAAGVGHPRCGGTVATGHQSGAGGRQRAAAATHDRPVHPLGGAPWALRTREAGVGVARGSVHARPACGNRADRWSGRNAAHVGARPQNNAHTYCFSFEFTQTGSDERANICCISGETIQKSQ